MCLDKNDKSNVLLDDLHNLDYMKHQECKLQWLSVPKSSCLYSLAAKSFNKRKSLHVLMREKKGGHYWAKNTAY